MQKKRSKILFILHTPPPVHGSSMVGKFIKESKLIRNAFECRFINLSTSSSIDQIGKAGITKLFRYLSIIIKLISALLFYRPELCYFAITSSGFAFYKDSILVLISRLVGVNLVFHFHNKGVRKNQTRRIDNCLYRLVFKDSYAILLSAYLYSDIEKYFKQNNVFYCPNGIPSIPLNNYSVKSNIESIEKVKILFLSNLIESKGVFDLLSACQLLISKGVDFMCVFVGGIADINEDAFATKVNELGLDGYVKYEGRKVGDEKILSLRDADIFAFPTYYHNECFPLVLLEAMQFSLPVISTFEGGIQDIIERDKSGFLIKQRDVIQLAEYLALLITDPNLRKKMGHAGRKRYEENFTLEIFEHNLKNILEEIIEKNK